MRPSRTTALLKSFKMPQHSPKVFDMPNMENYFIYHDYQYQLVSHILVLGFGAMIAGLVYFLLTANSIMPKYRISSYIGCVVMVSAGLILFTQYQSWENAFTYVNDGDVSGWLNPSSVKTLDQDLAEAGAISESSGPASGKLFSNGFRYMNWSIDVPALQIQLLAVIGVAGLSFVRNAVKFTIAGLAMIYFSYAAQFFEYGFAEWDNSNAATWFWIYYILGWVAYLYILYAVYTSVFQQTEHLHPRAQRIMNGIWLLFLVSWTVYGIAIAIPAFAFSTHGVVWRQFLFTSADIVSKVIYGAMLSQVALYQSAAEGYEPAIAACQWDKVTSGDTIDYSAEREWRQRGGAEQTVSPGQTT